jgi:hypothetical protein
VAPRADPSPQFDDAVERIRAICSRLPETEQQEAWTGTRWQVRSRTFAHVLEIVDGWPPAYVRAAGTEGPSVVLTFESSGDELDALTHLGHPFFKPVWRTGVVGMLIDATTDWTEVAELVTESHRMLAPRRLVSDDHGAFDQGALP